MVTIKDIARQAGLSPSTVSRALNDNPIISAKTRERVKRLARELGYERNELARGLVKGALDVLGLIIPDITNPFFAEVARGVEDAAHRRGFGLILCNTDNDSAKETEYVHLLQRKRVKGLVLASVTAEGHCLQDLERDRVPAVLVSRLVRNPRIEVSYVSADDRRGGFKATEYLINLGHRRIGFIGGPENVVASQERYAGYREALQQHGLTYDKQLARYADFTRAAGRDTMRDYLKLTSQRRPTAVFAANDMIALGVLEAVEEAGLHVPDDISVIGYNNISYTSLPRIMLTTIAQPMHRMGFLATEYLLDVLEGRKRGRLQLLLEPELVVRKTCRPPVARSA